MIGFRAMMIGVRSRCFGAIEAPGITAGALMLRCAIRRRDAAYFGLIAGFERCHRSSLMAGTRESIGKCLAVLAFTFLCVMRATGRRYDMRS